MGGVVGSGKLSWGEAGVLWTNGFSQVKRAARGRGGTRKLRVLRPNPGIASSVKWHLCHQEPGTDVARLAGQPGGFAGRGPLDPCAPLREGRLYWGAVDPPAIRSSGRVCESEGPRFLPRMGPVPQATSCPFHSSPMQEPLPDAAKRPQTSDPPPP